MTDVRPILASYPQLRGNPRVTPVMGGGFSGAGIFQIATEGVSLCLRRWPELRPPIERLRELHMFLGFVHERGVTEIAVPVPSRDGTTLLEVDGGLWQLEPWKSGKADFVAKPTTKRLRAAMHALARFHIAAAEYEPTDGGRAWFFQAHGRASPAVIERIRMVREWTPSRVRVVLAANHDLFSSAIRAEQFLRQYSWAAPVVDRELTRLAETRFRLHPCLRDIWHAHVLFEGDQVTGIIDPGATRSDNVASDLSRLLGSCLADDWPRWQVALNAYAEVRPLSESERQLVRVLDRSSVLLSGLAWIERAAPSGPGAKLEAMARFQWIQGRLGALASSIGDV